MANVSHSQAGRPRDSRVGGPSGQARGLAPGLSLQQLDADRWVVDVDARDAEVAQERLAQ